MRAVEEPGGVCVLGIGYGLTAAWPPCRLQPLGERRRALFCDRFGRLRGEELLGEVHGEVRVLVLMASGEACVHQLS